MEQESNTQQIMIKMECVTTTYLTFILGLMLGIWLNKNLSKR